MTFEEVTKNLEQAQKHLAKAGYNVGPIIKGRTKKESWIKRKIAMIRFVRKNRSFL